MALKIYFYLCLFCFFFFCHELMILAETVRGILRMPRILNLQRNAKHWRNACILRAKERRCRLPCLRFLVVPVRGSSPASIPVGSSCLSNRRSKKKGFCTVLKVVHRNVTNSVDELRKKFRFLRHFKDPYV